MAILHFHQYPRDESSDEPVVLEIVPESNGELVVIHRHPRPASVALALELTPIGLHVMYRLVEVLWGWPKSLPKGLTKHKGNGEFLDKLIIDVKLVTDDFMTTWIDEGTSRDLHLPGRLVYALLLTNVNNNSNGRRDQCLICGLPVEEDRRAHLLATDLELCCTNSSCGYWTLMGISLEPGFGDGLFKLCPDHELSLTRVFKVLMIRGWYQRDYSYPRNSIGE